MYQRFIFVILLICTRCIAQVADPELKLPAKAESPAPWTHLNLENDPRNFQFAIVTDRTGGHRPGVFEDAITKLNLLRPEFVMSVGDLIEGYSRDAAAIEREWDEFTSFTAKLKMPFFYVPGNHDLSNDVQHQIWTRRFGRKFYHFVYRDVLFLAVNSEDPQRRISPEQIAYFKSALEENPNVRWTLVFLHQPLWLHEDRGRTARNGDDIGWAELEKLLRQGNRQFTVFAGHLHNYVKEMRDVRRFVVLASTGGGSQLRGVPFGEFDHVAWVTMTDEGPIVANLLLSGIWDEDVVTQKSRQRVDELVSAARLVVHPIPMHAGRFDKTTHPLKLVNDANIPLTVSARFRPHLNFRPDPYAIDETIEPNSVKTIDLVIDPRIPAADGHTPKPLVADVTLSYALADGRKQELKLERVLSIGIDGIIDSPRITEPVLVNGRHDDWPDARRMRNGTRAWPQIVLQPTQLKGNPRAWKTFRDASFGFATAHDDEFLYIAVDVIDDRVITTPANAAQDGQHFHRDGVEIRLDARPDPARSSNRHDEEMKDFLLLSICPGETREAPFVYQREQSPEGTKIAAVEVDDGYNIEVAIPLKYLRERNHKAEFRLNVAVNDTDTLAPANSAAADAPDDFVQAWWRPDWRSDETYDGSGTFRLK